MHTAFKKTTTFLNVGGVSSKKVCSYQDILDYLNLTAANDAFKMTRPVLDHTHRTVAQLDIFLYAILAVIEKSQTFVPFIWIMMTWHNERISWDPAQFCGITQISIPESMLWKPDIFISEMTEKDNSNRNPYMYVFHDGMVRSEEDMRVVSTCQIDIHKFPFDTQSCTITASSAVHADDEFQLISSSNSSQLTKFSRELMMPLGEWDFLHLSITKNNLSFAGKHWDQLLYTFTIKRRPLLHVINFLFPVLFFLCLDLASFLISDHRGDKLGFKVTVLLAISVLLLILNDILPSMSNRTPLIATYCIVIFALMLLSVLETILVMYLMERASASKEKQKVTDVQDKDLFNCNTEEKSQTSCTCIFALSSNDSSHELPPGAEVNSKETGETRVLLLILKELKEVQKTFNLLLSSRDGRPVTEDWITRLNRVFFAFYFISVVLFLSFMWKEWSS
ncbi:5-hydroxytryptamine receptor 3A-like [Genypterus blacodes]|uniref:5-hydroxytryptamine receptor 3A-like n=1 Tax=Genypterus blacodes TaxID=154954 RepID=UPI003F76DA50